MNETEQRLRRRRRHRHRCFSFMNKKKSPSVAHSGAEVSSYRVQFIKFVEMVKLKLLHQNVVNLFVPSSRVSWKGA